MSSERRVNERVRFTFRKYVKRWVEMSTARKIATAFLIGGGAASATFGACRGGDIMGPSSPSSAPSASAPRPNASLGGDLIPELPSLIEKEDESLAQANPDFVTSTQTTFETTEAVYNPCMNETPILNGFIKIHQKTKFDGLTLKYSLHSWKHTKGVAATATAYWDHDNDASTKMESYTVRYHNNESALDKFTVGPATLAYSSNQESRIHLIREGDTRKTIMGGDDLFVIASQKVKIDENGVVHEKFQYRTECK